MPKPFIPNDYFARQARASGWLARSAFKLQEIIKKFPVIKSGQTVLDLGAAPGSWLQVVSQMIGSRGKIIGVDITPIKFRAPNVTTLEMDILHSDSAKKLEAFGLFDIVLSDLAPKTSGIKTRDQALSLELDQQVINLAQNLLKPGGAIIIKIFQSPDMHHFIKQIETMFSFVHVYKPQASRDRSFETYLIGLDKID